MKKQLFRSTCLLILICWITIDARAGYSSTSSPSNALHRLDFRIEGKSCAVCLISIQNRLKAVAGVIKVAIMLKSPYGASIIYDSNKVAEPKLLETVKHDEPKIKLQEVADQRIDKMPAVLIPPHNKLVMPLPQLPQIKGGS